LRENTRNGRDEKGRIRQRKREDSLEINITYVLIEKKIRDGMGSDEMVENKLGGKEE
jgi:hypothetical protein